MISIAAVTSLLRSWLQTEIIVIDVGARWGVGERWMPFGPHVTLIGFDPDEQECARLNDMASAASDDGPKVRYVPTALGSVDGTATLHLTREPACSSLYPPLEELVSLRPHLSVIAPVGSQDVAIMTLDSWARSVSLPQVHVLKLDTQGSELDVLRGAVDVLKGVQLIEVEVEFNEIYEGQPLFGDVDRFLRDRGFVLWRLQQLVHYGFADLPSASTELADRHYFDSEPVDLAGRGGQLYWGHAYFVPRHLAFPTAGGLAWHEAVRAACAATAFGFVDLAVSILRRAEDAPADAVSALHELV